MLLHYKAVIKRKDEKPRVEYIKVDTNKDATVRQQVKQYCEGRNITLCETNMRLA